jgi:hypothetical protein
MRIAVNGADKPDQHTEVVLTAKPEIQLVCSTNVMCNIGIALEYTAYSAAYNMVGLRCFNEELSLLPKNPTEAKLQATSTRGESTEPT